MEKIKGKGKWKGIGRMVWSGFGFALLIMDG